MSFKIACVFIVRIEHIHHNTIRMKLQLIKIRNHKCLQVIQSKFVKIVANNRQKTLLTVFVAKNRCEYQNII